MSMHTAPAPRIPLPGPEALDPAQRRVFDSVVNGRRGTLVGPLRAALHNPELAERWHRFGEILRYETVLPPALNELAILITARRWNSELEWTIHARAARQGGLPEPVIEAIREGQAPEFSDPAAAEVYDYVQALQTCGQVSDAVHAAVTARWGVVGVVELTAVTGYYSMVAMTLNAHRIPLPEAETPELYPGGEMPPNVLSPVPARQG
ncbi:carboxymuconolactone decarboxylase family protein [Mangrovibrevibacter kandeliae]|uniref:carboxymuconolactone decarboxylase family protein n=1 Tax=Mangrovibrevibacter kandeliae TaxID=2968473 RepID=UPI0021177DCB|nr:MULTISPECIES: carboxymuconolactone decarboxylase family protein [unclassified Aurantimonas]MCQ8781894.1 carboxymuconolactone decarboxylase family protein [Aurantimonas sp. CSK15Z-1]MCW4115448.1 carboxymuconolactone decarboxylase family protein [Aurantimonas sp. MSK8Z-1]